MKSPKLWLKAERAQQIRKTALELLRRVHYVGGIVPVDRAAHELGASIRYAPYDGELAGMLIRNGSESVIAVNSAHHKNRQRFTIAHECGHLCLHSDKLYVDKNFFVLNRDERSSNADDIKEIEANQFAAELLMPFPNLFRDLRSSKIDLEDEQQISNVAKLYGVSVQAMTYRVANLFMIQLVERPK
ncbi:ImmA/IrrE family metallo-endopeptidase [Mesorhizobium sp. M0518]|uniref:ImmA/IrrE family metallo-endopeptidase n=1 Tax=Mesorhizobium sp. M0518 TaxID=2956956 RepID=UPI00333B8D3D